MSDEKKAVTRNANVAKAESRELRYLWKTYVKSAHGIHRSCGIWLSVVSAVSLFMVIVALFIDSRFAWLVVQVLNDAADDVADALGVQRN
jgi:hypothetical protein